MRLSIALFILVLSIIAWSEIQFGRGDRMKTLEKRVMSLEQIEDDRLNKYCLASIRQCRKRHPGNYQCGECLLDSRGSLGLTN